ncbi:methylmalonyl Co-A mutase-associated GTPase MeaB [Gordonia sp. LSe1-13]|uniref:Methylmalonyl Co-A mutase-associated GTPase MeaB n=1 Tax=Gordonia sesuvii TaxID=3116777 RepID=A0ABU7M8T1_9ACTN|nr:methylmalonyl Co-A mutase-associated GTPase MeaB [Gordonia sp. LSe1-13]
MADDRPTNARPIGELLAAARGGSARAAGRLLTHVEGEGRASVLEAIGPPRGTISVIGITGPPGAGKSTTITALVAAYRARGTRVAVLAVDPTSPYSGGALLGDRIRMTQHIDDPDVLIRSMATRGHLGGLTSAVPAAIRLLEALGHDIVLVETVGVGQSEVEVSAIADPTVVVLNPGAGDAVQAAKAGLLEAADILVVNKADRDGAQQTVRDLRMESHAPVLTLVASRSEGIDELVDTIDRHRRDDDATRRTARVRSQVLSLAMTRLRTHPALGDVVDDVVTGRCDVYSAVEHLVIPR